MRRYGGDLQGILERLDHIQGLGVIAILLNPIIGAPPLIGAMRPPSITWTTISDPIPTAID
jgi:hypothetical protein